MGTFGMSRVEKLTTAVKVWWCGVMIAQVKGDNEKRRGGKEGQNGNGRKERKSVPRCSKERKGKGKHRTGRNKSTATVELNPFTAMFTVIPVHGSAQTQKKVHEGKKGDENRLEYRRFVTCRANP